MGRKACDAAKVSIEESKSIGKETVVARYTDSCQFMLPSDPKTLASQLKKVQSEWPVIQDKIRETMGSHLVDFKLEDRYAVVKIYLK